MKNLKIIPLLFLSLIIMSCSSDDVTAANNPTNGPTIKATINGGPFSNYNFQLGVYQVKKQVSPNKLTIEMADREGKQLTILLNGTGGFDAGVEKVMGDTDDSKFRTYINIRNNNPAGSFYSNSGSLKITSHRPDPDDNQQMLISGEFSITAATQDAPKDVITFKGKFTDLAYKK